MSKQTETVEEYQLQRKLSPMHVWAIAFGCVIGWGSFINPGKKFLPNSGVAGTAIAMAMGALVMIIIAFSYAYMVPKYPKAGGEFTFTKMCFGKNMAFICGWFLVVAYLTNVPMNSTAIGLIVDGLDGPADILKWGFHYNIAGFDIYLGEMLLAMFILLLFGYLNIIGVQKAAIVQTILSSLLVICVFTLCLAGIFSAKAKGVNMQPIWGFDKSAAIAAKANTSTIDPFARAGTAGILSAILATFAIAPWAYVGFDGSSVPNMCGKRKFPSSMYCCSITLYSNGARFFAPLSRLPSTERISSYLYGTIRGAKIIRRIINPRTIRLPTASGFLKSFLIPSLKNVVLSLIISCWAFSSSVAFSNFERSS